MSAITELRKNQFLLVPTGWYAAWDTKDRVSYGDVVKVYRAWACESLEELPATLEDALKQPVSTVVVYGSNFSQLHHSLVRRVQEKIEPKGGNQC